MSKFQVILTAIFVVFIVTGVVVFATYKGRSSDNALPQISIWGTFPQSVFVKYVGDTNITRAEALKINYRQISEDGFDKVFIEALARGQGPDAILIGQDQIHKHEDKVIPIPYDILTERDFRNTYIQQAELYLHPNGVLALPFLVDPLVMYWNRDMFTNASIATFPYFWDEFDAVGARITEKDVNSNIRKSVIAMGEFSNVNHSREILGALLLQSGNPVTFRDSGTLLLSSALGNNNSVGLSTSMPAVQFFTKFSDPRNREYSWNRSLPNSKNFFLSGGLATYIGFASEIFDLREKNPNLDFDVAPLPQARGGTNRTTFGDMYGFSIVRSTTNVDATYQVLLELLSPSALNELVNASYLPPVRRDMISAGTTDPYLAIFYDSALISKGWLDTNKAETYQIFKNIVESVTTGRKSLINALEEGSDEYDLSLQNI